MQDMQPKPVSAGFVVCGARKPCSAGYMEPRNNKAQLVRLG